MEAWQLIQRGVSVKRYPVCYATHRAVDGVIDLVGQADLDSGAVAGVTVYLGHAPAATVDNARPATGLAAKFSIQHNVAAALLDRQLGFAQLTDAYVGRADVAACLGLTSIALRDEPCPEQPGMALHDRVVIRTRDGRTLDSGDIRYPRGHVCLPLSDADRAAKFRDCAEHGQWADPDRLLACLQKLERAAGLQQVFAHAA